MNRLGIFSPPRALGLLFLTSLAFASDSSPSNDHTFGSAKPLPGEQESSAKENSVTIREYDGSIRGIKALMAELKSEDPQVHEALLPNYAKLRRRHNLGSSVLWGGRIAGVGLVSAGIARILITHDNDDDTKGFGLVLIGALVPLTGRFLSTLFYPSEQDYKEFTNKHNRINRKSQIQWKDAGVMLNRDDSLMLALELSF